MAAPGQAGDGERDGGHSHRPEEADDVGADEGAPDHLTDPGE